MLTIEMDYDSTVIVTLDEEDNFEDVEVVMDEDVVYISQYVEGTNEKQILLMSTQQLMDIVGAMDLPDGAYYLTEAYKR